MTTDTDFICALAADGDDLAARALAAVRRGLDLPARGPGEAGASFFAWQPFTQQQVVCASRPFDIDGVAHVRVTSCMPMLRHITAPRDEVDVQLSSLNHLTHRSCHVFHPEARSIDAMQSMLVSDATLDAKLPLLLASCRLQFLHSAFHGRRLAELLGGRAGPREWRIEPALREPLEAIRSLRPVLNKDESGGNPFADRFELDAIVSQANASNAFSSGANVQGTVVHVPFDQTTATIGLKVDEPHPFLGEGVIVHTKLPIYGELRGLQSIAGWLNRKEAAGAIAADQSGAWYARPFANNNLVVHMQFLPKFLYRPGLLLETFSETVRKIRLVNALMNPGVPERDVLEVIRERMLDTRRQAPPPESRPERPVAH